MSSSDDWFVNSAPVGEVAVPAAIAHLVHGAEANCVWVNALGGLTFELPGLGRFLKWAPAGSAPSLDEEAARMRWARPYTPVPEVLDAGVAVDGSTWLLTVALPGTTAVADRWKASPRVAVRAIGEGLRAMHDSLPATTSPFTWAAEERLERARTTGRERLANPARWHPSHRHLTADEAMAIVADPPPVDRPVVCHADACAPNTLIGDDGRWVGHVDLGRMGTADRWADLAIATWSSEWNYGPGWEDELLAAYDVAPDPDRTRYYRLLWDLTD